MIGRKEVRKKNFFCFERPDCEDGSETEGVVFGGNLLAQEYLK